MSLHELVRASSELRRVLESAKACRYDDLLLFKKEALSDAARSRGLSYSGTKPQLAQRLFDSFQCVKRVYSETKLDPKSTDKYEQFARYLSSNDNIEQGLTVTERGLSVLGIKPMNDLEYYSQGSNVFPDGTTFQNYGKADVRLVVTRRIITNADNQGLISHVYKSPRPKKDIVTTLLEGNPVTITEQELSNINAQVQKYGPFSYKLLSSPDFPIEGNFIVQERLIERGAFKSVMMWSVKLEGSVEKRGVIVNSKEDIRDRQRQALVINTSDSDTILTESRFTLLELEKEPGCTSCWRFIDKDKVAWVFAVYTYEVGGKTYNQLFRVHDLAKQNQWHIRYDKILDDLWAGGTVTLTDEEYKDLHIDNVLVGDKVYWTTLTGIFLIAPLFEVGYFGDKDVHKVRLIREGHNPLSISQTVDRLKANLIVMLTPRQYNALVSSQEYQALRQDLIKVIEEEPDDAENPLNLQYVMQMDKPAPPPECSIQ